nr:RNA-directed DNA polymerase, eukaryota [Tanacetum cinerariifolium]
MIRGEWIPNGKMLLIISIYAPRELSKKNMLWDYLTVVIGNWNGKVVIMGDFNEVRTQVEWYGSIFNVQGANAFNSFILDAGLEEGFDTLVERTWNEAQVIDSNDISKLMKKLKYFKEKIRAWIKSKKGNFSNHKKILKAGLAEIELLLDRGECDSEVQNKRLFVTKSLHDLKNLASMEVVQKIKWTIKGYENSKYYHGILNKKEANSLFVAPRLQLDTVFPNKLNIEQQIDLECDVSRDKIKRAIVVYAGMFRGISMGTSLRLSHLFYTDDVVFMGQWSDSNIGIIVKALECFYRASGLRINMNKSKLMGISWLMLFWTRLLIALVVQRLKLHSLI